MLWWASSSEFSINLHQFLASLSVSLLKVETGSDDSSSICLDVHEWKFNMGQIMNMCFLLFEKTSWSLCVANVQAILLTCLYTGNLACWYQNVPCYEARQLPYFEFSTHQSNSLIIVWMALSRRQLSFPSTTWGRQSVPAHDRQYQIRLCPEWSP